MTKHKESRIIYKTTIALFLIVRKLGEVRVGDETLHRRN